MPTPPPPVILTENAASRLKALIAADGADDLAFRVSVSGGGCSGFNYNFDLSKEEEPGDISSQQHGIKVLVDSMSLLYVLGAHIDYVEELGGASFQVKNPNAQSSCGCGSSFSV